MSARRRAAVLPLLIAMALCSGADVDPRKAQQITFPEIPQHAAGDAPFSLTARASSGLPLTFSIIAGPADLDGGRVKLTGQSGLVIVRASQAGNEQFRPATDAERAFTVTAKPAAPRILSQPSPLSAAIGDTIVLEVTASGEPAPTYEWRRNGIAVTKAEGARLYLTSVSRGDEGDYTVVATNRLGSATSAAARVSVHKRDQLILFGGQTTITAGRPFFLQASASSGLPVSLELVSGTATFSGFTVTAGSGIVVIRATQPGDSTYEPATGTVSLTAIAGPGGPP